MAGSGSVRLAKASFGEEKFMTKISKSGVATYWVEAGKVVAL